MEPTAVTWAVLGLLAQRPRSGYDIKRAVDRTIRHFWAASYGQIYPELRRLEEAGWIEGADGSRGGRSRRIYTITAEGRRRLRAWLGGRETRIELRDESLLRLFFADTLPSDHALGLLAARREGYRAMLEYLRSLDDGTGPDPPFVDLVYRWALDYCEWGIDWCEQQERRLRPAA
ncbi:MAG TPA: PadR family transcriptional regulator [Gaiellaceae bacterium]|nr:PadR family transcriptional regulator [Gaiellaceae bacterium]